MIKANEASTTKLKAYYFLFNTDRGELTISKGVNGYDWDFLTDINCPVVFFLDSRKTFKTSQLALMDALKYLTLVEQ